MKKARIEVAAEDHLATLTSCDGYYECPRSPGTGERLGPLVGYAGTYDGPNGTKLQFVGDVYVNLAMAEMHGKALKYFADCLSVKLQECVGLTNVDVFCGAPIGGYALATALSILNPWITAIKAEKKTVALATETSREKSKLVFGRHAIEKGAKYVIVEDICNNFSTTAELIKLIISLGGEVVAIVCFLNRSLTVDNEYCLSLDGRADVLRIPVISLVRKPIIEWRQDDPAVEDDVARGNVVWKPKDQWGRLKTAMSVCM